MTESPKAYIAIQLLENSQNRVNKDKPAEDLQQLEEALACNGYFNRRTRSARCARDLRSTSSPLSCIQSHMNGNRSMHATSTLAMCEPTPYISIPANVSKAAPARDRGN